MKQPANPIPEELPRGPHRLPRSVVRGSQRRRLIEATAQLVTAQGYASTKVVEIASAAGVSMSTLYELFGDKEDLFLACYQAGSDAHRAAVERVFHSPGSSIDRAEAGIAAYLEMLGNRDFAIAYLIEAQYATPKIRARFLENLDAYADLHARWFEQARSEFAGLPEVPRSVWLGVVSGMSGLITQRIHARGVEGITEELTAPCLELMLAVAGLRGKR